MVAFGDFHEKYEVKNINNIHIFNGLIGWIGFRFQYYEWIIIQKSNNF